MQAASKEKLTEFQSIISKMSLSVCCMMVLPELGLRWKEVMQVVRNARLPMTSSSVARVLKRHAAKTMTEEDVQDVIAQLRIKLVASSGSKTWHALRLEVKHREEGPVEGWVRSLPNYIVKASRGTIKNMNTRLEVHSALLGDFVFLSLCKVTNGNLGNAMYAAVSPNTDFVFVTTAKNSALIKAFVEGLGYKKYSNPNVHGRDLVSMCRIMENELSADVNHLTDLPEYDPKPIITKNCIDYTNRAYKDLYLDYIFGSNPPLINNFDVNMTQECCLPDRYNKKMRVHLSLRSESVVESLRSWCKFGVISPDCGLVPMALTAGRTDQ